MTTIAAAVVPQPGPPPYSASAAHSGTATPSDYVKLHPAVQLPKVRHVGLLACQLDPLRRSLASRVISVKPSAPAPAPAKSGKRSKATDAPAELAPVVGRVFEVELEDTVLFPEGGGQNSDAGTMVLGEHELSVLHVLRQGLRAVHFVAVPAEAESVLVEQAEVVVHVDWVRRMDLMTHHTSQHLLSALLDALPEPAETLSWSLTPAPAPCYVEISRNLTPAEIAAVEDRANELIRQGTRVRVEVEDQEGGQGRELTEEERERLRKSSSSIPKGLSGRLSLVVDCVCLTAWVSRSPAFRLREGRRPDDRHRRRRPQPVRRLLLALTARPLVLTHLTLPPTAAAEPTCPSSLSYRRCTSCRRRRRTRPRRAG
jgi:misacylated tRNA(Ala) deacylase